MDTTGERTTVLHVSDMHFEDEMVHVEHIDFMTGEVVEERGSAFGEDGFTEQYREPPVSAAERYER